MKFPKISRIKNISSYERLSVGILYCLKSEGNSNLYKATSLSDHLFANLFNENLDPNTLQSKGKYL